jgi:hypothetical protein
MLTLGSVLEGAGAGFSARARVGLTASAATEWSSVGQVFALIFDDAPWESFVTLIHETMNRWRF